MARKSNNILQRLLSIFKKQKLLPEQSYYRRMYAELIKDFSADELERFDKEIGKGNHIFCEYAEGEDTISIPCFDAYKIVNLDVIRTIFESDELFDECMGVIHSYDPERSQKLERAVVPYMEILSSDGGKRHSFWSSEIEFSSLLYGARMIYGDKASTEVREKIALLEKELSLDKLRQGDFSILIQNQILSVPKSLLVDMILGSSEDLKEHFADRENEEAKKLEIALKSFISTETNRSPILEYYDFPESAYRRCEDILDTNFTDNEVLKAKVSDKTKFSDEIKLTPELKNAVYNDMPEGLSDLDKAVYMYGRLCQILTYDPGVYAERERGPITLAHEDRERLNTITPENNRVICYEFSYLYAKFLEEQGIKHNVISKSRSKEYGGAHAYCEFVADNMHIKADSTALFFEGDLIAMKCGYRPNGLIVQTAYQDKREKLNESIGRMMEVLNTPNRRAPTSELINLYRDVSESERTIPNAERFDTFREVIERDKYTAPYSLESMTYALQMSRMIFNKEHKNEEVEDTFRLEIMKRNANVPTAIIEHRHAANGKSTYYEYGPEKKLEKRTVTQLRDDLVSGQLDIISRRDAALGFVERIYNMHEIEEKSKHSKGTEYGIG